MTKLKWHTIGNRTDRFEFDPTGETFMFACCDCGLTHDLGIKVKKNGKVIFTVKKNLKVTKKNRDSWKK